MTDSSVYTRRNMAEGGESLFFPISPFPFFRIFTAKHILGDAHKFTAITRTVFQFSYVYALLNVTTSEPRSSLREITTAHNHRPYNWPKEDRTFAEHHHGADQVRCRRIWARA
jgi:hypothetical protein